MKLNQYTDFSLRVLMYLAVTGKEKDLATIREISKVYDVSKNHLVKVVHRLSQLGYLETSTGKNGGIRLGKPPEDINIGKVVREMEASMDLVECMQKGDTGKTCIITGNCVLANILEKSLNAFMNELSRYTLKDIVKNSAILKAKFTEIG